MRHIGTKVNSHQTKDNKKFEIVVSKFYIDEFGKESVERKIWDIVGCHDFIRVFDNAKRHNPEFYNN